MTSETGCKNLVPVQAPPEQTPDEHRVPSVTGSYTHWPDTHSPAAEKHSLGRVLQVSESQGSKLSETQKPAFKIIPWTVTLKLQRTEAVPSGL